MRIRAAYVLMNIVLASVTMQGATWSTGGPQYKTIKVTAISPQTPSVVYAGAFGWGVFRSTDGGATWSNSRTGMINTYVRSLLVLSDVLVYAGTNDGVYKTTDGGIHWTEVLKTANSVRSIAIDANTGSIYAASYGTGLFKTTNQGVSWSPITVTDPNTLQTLTHLWVVAPYGRDSLYVGGSILDIPSGSGGALFRSVNGGTSWFQMQYPTAIRSSVHSIAISPVNPAAVFIFGTAVKGVYLSSNGGSTFSNIDGTGTATNPLPDPHVNTVGFSRAFYYAGTDSLGRFYRRAVGDATVGWLPATGLPGAPAMINSVAFSQASSDILYAGTDGQGMMKSLDSGKTWIPSRSGMMGVAGYALQYHASGKLFLGTDLGDGMWYSVDSARSWIRVDSFATVNSIPSLGMTSDPLTLYAGTYGSGVFKSTDGGTIWHITDSASINQLVRPIEVHPTDPNTVYAGTSNGIYKTTNGGTSWSPVNSGIPASTSIRSLDLNRATPSILLAGTDSAYLYRTTNAGLSWTHITNANGFLPQDIFIRSVTIDQNSPLTVYAGSDSGHLYRSTDGGLNWSLLAALPSTHSVRKILLHPNTPGTLFAATFGEGLFVSTNGGTEWSSMSAGLTDSALYTVESDRASPLNLFAGSRSSGVFRTNYQPIDHPPVIAPIGNKSVYTGHLLSFTVTASDPDLTIPALSAAGLPAGASFTDHADGTGSFSWTPGTGDIGVYQVTFTASDGILADSQRVRITVVDSASSAIISVNMLAGWNLISLPLVPSDQRTSQLFPAAASSAYGYSGKYVRRDTLVPGPGYWLKFSASVAEDLIGRLVQRDTVPVSAGWNIIGSISGPVAVSSIISQPPGMIVSHFFLYSGSYSSTDTLRPGSGYWVKVGQAGALILASPGALSASELQLDRVQIVAGPELPPDPPVLSGASGPPVSEPVRFVLHQNYPNPFNSGTLIRYDLPRDARVTMKVYNVTGEQVAALADEQRAAGSYTVAWNAGWLPSGVYYLRLTASAGGQELYSGTRAMLLIR